MITQMLLFKLDKDKNKIKRESKFMKYSLLPESFWYILELTSVDRSLDKRIHNQHELENVIDGACNNLLLNTEQ